MISAIGTERSSDRHQPAVASRAQGRSSVITVGDRCGVRTDTVTVVGARMQRYLVGF